MMTYAEYAESRKITKPAVYQYIKKHPNDFKGHIKTNEKKTKVLDDEAISILDTNIRKPAFEQQLIVDGAATQFHTQELLDLEREKNALKDQLIAETTKTREQLFEELRALFSDMPKLEDSSLKEELTQVREELAETKKQNIELQEQNRQIIAIITAMQEEQKKPKHRIFRFLNK